MWCSDTACSASAGDRDGDSITLSPLPFAKSALLLSNYVIISASAAPFPWIQYVEMSSSCRTEPLRLPSLSLKSPSPPKSRADKSLSSDLELPLLPSATKAEKYARLSQFDRSGLKRQKAHVRNALKTTESIQKITKQLNEVDKLHNNIVYYACM